MRIRRVWGRRLAALVVGGVVAATGAAPGFGAAAPPSPDADVVARLRSAETPGGEGLLVGATVQVGVARPSEVLLPVAAFDMGGTRPVILKEIQVAGPDGRTRASVRPGKRMRPMSDLAVTKADVLAQLADRDRARARALSERGYAGEVLRVPTADLPLADGTTTTFGVTAVFDVDGNEKTAVLPLQVTVAALPTQSYWYAGDGHVHSSTWSDGWYSLATRASQAKASGHKWLFMTDHWRGIWSTAGRGDANWARYCNDCSTGQAAAGLPVLPGVELMTAAGAGHALGYGLSSSKVPPRDESYAGQSLITSINGHTTGSSYAVIAHPYQAWPNTPWSDWTVTGFRSIELLSNERQASAGTQSRWFSLLRGGIATKIAGGSFVVGLGNTDAHFQRPGEAGITWVRSATSPLTRAAVLTAIKNGACSASGREDLGYFTVNGVQQGGVAVAYSASTVNFSITQKPVTGRKCTEITIRNSSNGVVWSVVNPAATTYAKSLPAPATDTFYVVKMVFANTGNTDYSHVWCNPVFVDRR